MYQIEQDQYVNFIKGFLDKPYNLTNAWVEYQKEKGNNVVFFTDDLIQPQIICWGRVKKVQFIGELLDLEGPIYKESVNIKIIHKFLESLKSLPYKGLLINLNTNYSVDFEVAVRKSLFKRPVGQVNTSLTIVVNTNSLNVDSNWRRNLKKASKCDFTFEIKEKVSLEDCKVISSLHDENAKLKNLNYNLKASELYKLVNREKIYTCFLKENNTPISARIISVDNSTSHDVFACNSLRARNNGATQFLMQKIFEYLKNRGVYKFDFSRIPIGKKGGAGVYDFKNSTRGIISQYNGEWVFFKKEKLRHFYYLYNLFINKKDFY